MLLGLIVASLCFAQDTEAPALQFLPGTSEEFQSLAREVRAATASGEYDLAARLASSLPKRELIVSWDDSEVPESLRATYRGAFESALEAFRAEPVSLAISEGSSSPDIKFVFVSTMLVEGEQSAPAAAAFFSVEPGDPAVEVVLAVHRGSEQGPSGPADIHNEVLYGLGAYLGLARVPRPGTAMWRTDGMSQVRNRLSPIEMRMAQHNLLISEMLRRAIASRESVDLVEPSMTLQPLALDIDRPIQGSIVFLDMQINNFGDADLNYSIVPDCGCFAFEYPTMVAPGRNEQIRIAIDTLEFPGPFDKAFYIYSNDPETPVRRVHVTGYVRPVFEFTGIDGGVLHLDALQGDVEVMLTLQPEFEANITGVTLAGVVGDVRFAEQPRNSDSEPRVFRITASPSLQGDQRRTTASISVTTDDQRFRVLRYGFIAQDGIAAQPAMIYFGEVGEGVHEAWAIIDQPGRPFNVTGVRSTTEFFTVRYERVSETRYRVFVTLVADAPVGSTVGSVVVSTDRAEQPTLEIPIQAFKR